MFLNKRIQILLLLATGSCLAVAWFIWLKNGSLHVGEDTPGKFPRVRGEQVSKVATSGDLNRVANDGGKTRRGVALSRLKTSWLSIVKSLEGDELEEAQASLAGEAVDELQCSEELLKFLEFLNLNEEGYYARRIKNRGMRELFKSEQNSIVREQLLALPDEKIRLQWSYFAGEGFRDGDFEEYLSRLKDLACVQNALAGYCATTAAIDPENAVRLLADVLVKRELPTGIVNGGLPYVMENLPENADFEAIDLILPDDMTGRQTFKSSRGVMFSTWSKTDPLAAANYIVEHPDRIEPRQLKRVFTNWLKEDADAAVSWAQGLAHGAHRDASLAKSAIHLSGTHPAKAWQLGLQIEESEEKTHTLKFVFNSWHHLDQASAEAAYHELESQTDPTEHQ